MNTLLSWLKRFFVILYAWLYLTGRLLDRRPRLARFVYGGLTLMLLFVLGILYLTRPAVGTSTNSTDGISDLTEFALSFAPRATATPTNTPTPVPTPTPTVPPVLAACDTDLQTQAMRPDHVPNWEALAIDACYDMTLTVSPATQSYTGTATITYTNHAGVPLSELVFRTYPNAPYIYGGRLNVSDVHVDGTPITTEVFLDDGTGLRVLLPTPLPAGSSTSIAMDFTGDVPVNYGDGTYGIFNYDGANNVVALANWYPILAPYYNGGWDAASVVRAGDAVVSDVALYRVRVSAPEGWTILTTGSRVTPTVALQQRTFVSGPVREFMVVAGTNFEPSETRIGDVRLVHWGLPSGNLAWNETLTVARDAFTTYERAFGSYPYAELDVAAVPLRTIMGMEYPGLSLIDAGIYDGMQRPFLPIMTAHEVAHQWWYGVVGNDAIRAPWQDEGLTEFSALLYFKEHQPAQYTALLQTYEQNVAGYHSVAGDEPLAQGTEAFIGRRQTYETIAYYKGLLFFKALYDELGEQRFFDALQSYYRQNHYTLASTDTLLHAFETSCGCNLSSLYAEWGVRGD